MIVVDVGCQTHGPEESVERLLRRFHPQVLFGFDPHPDLSQGVSCWGPIAVVVRRRAALWTHNGVVRMRFAGMCSAVADEGEEVAAVDAGTFLAALPLSSTATVLKLDAEMAEVPILERVHDLGLDRLLNIVLVEWHDGNPLLADRIEAAVPDYVARKERLLKGLRCPVENW